MDPYPGASYTCAQYNQCPCTGYSGFDRTGTAGNQSCNASYSDGMGTYPVTDLGVGGSKNRLAGSPFRWTMPKFVCLTYPNGTSNFNVTYTVGVNSRAELGYGRAFLFGAKATALANWR